MRALTVQPGVAGSVALDDIPPVREDGAVLVDVLQVGICGTDLEIVAGEYGEAPAGDSRLVLGHESIGRVREAPAGSELAEGDGLAEGDLVVAIVRHPDPVPCSNCAVGEWDMCRNGRYTEHGIKGLQGFARESYRADPEFVVRIDPALADVGVLLEPATVLAKAWEHIEHMGRRAHWRPETVLITGAGPIGLLAALLSVQRGLETHVLDRVKEGAKPKLVKDLGAHYHAVPLGELDLVPDVVIECTGVPSLVIDSMSITGLNGILCLTGVSPAGRKVEFDAGALGREIVLQNDVIFGSVNANRRHYELASQALLEADLGWLRQLITRRVPMEGFADALSRRDDDIKVVLEIAR